MSEHQGQIDPTDWGDLLWGLFKAIGFDLSNPWHLLAAVVAAAVIGSAISYGKPFLSKLGELNAAWLARRSTQVPEIKPSPEQPTTGAAPRPRQLPSDLPDFTGRDEEFRALMARLRGDEAGAAVSAVGGMGGVGKSALAIHVAHRVAEHYPDGQILIDLRGTKERPLTPAEAMAEVVRALEPEVPVPEDAVQAAGLYRTILAGKRLLVLFDDAENSAQVGPLVPEPPAAALITSRQPIVVPGVRRFSLDAMTPPESRALLREIVDAERASDEALDEIAVLCVHLPLALRVAGTYLATHATWSAADYAEALRANQLRLQVGDDPRLNVEAVLGLSAARLAADRRELAERWQMLSVFPAGFDLAAAAAVAWDDDEAPAREGLGMLEARSLVLFDRESARYRLHDLMREVARDAFGYGEDKGAAAGERQLAKAAARHAGHFYSVLAKADDLYLEGGEQVLTGLALFDAERSNIEAGQRWAAGNAAENDAATRLCSAYASMGSYVLILRLHPTQWISWLHSAAVAARRLGEREAECYHLGNMGIAFAQLGETRRAVKVFEQALVILQETSNRRAEGGVFGNLGNAYRQLGDFGRAIDFQEKALEIAREIGDRRSEGIAVGNLGNAYRGLGEPRRAIDFYGQQLEIVREIGDRHGEGTAIGNLGIAYSDLGEIRRAIEFYEQNLKIAREIGDRRGEGNALGSLANAYRDLGNGHRAVKLYKQSLVLVREIGDRRVEGITLGNLGNAYSDLGEPRRAIELYEQHLKIAREIGDRHAEGTALYNLAIALMKVGERARAIELAERSLQIRLEIEDPNADKVRTALADWRGGG